jgi:hypothetical protein
MQAQLLQAVKQPGHHRWSMQLGLLALAAAAAVQAAVQQQGVAAPAPGLAGGEAQQLGVPQAMPANSGKKHVPGLMVESLAVTGGV